MIKKFDEFFEAKSASLVWKPLPISKSKKKIYDADPEKKKRLSKLNKIIKDIKYYCAPFLEELEYERSQSKLSKSKRGEIFLYRGYNSDKDILKKSVRKRRYPKLIIKP